MRDRRNLFPPRVDLNDTMRQVDGEQSWLDALRPSTRQIHHDRLSVVALVRDPCGLGT